MDGKVNLAETLASFDEAFQPNTGDSAEWEAAPEIEL
jgi:hypothetical protein